MLCDTIQINKWMPSIIHFYTYEGTKQMLKTARINIEKSTHFHDQTCWGKTIELEVQPLPFKYHTGDYS